MIRPTKLKDVAKAAGVSQGTASNAFNRPELVRPELRAKVEAAAAALGYSGPDPKGRLLRAGKFNAIGVVPAGAYGISVAFGNAYMRDFMVGVAAACDAHGASLTLVSGVDEDKVRGIKNALVDGFILYRLEDVELLEAKRRRLPFVVVDEEGDAETRSVRIDDREGARMAARHLVALGHRRFAIFSVLRDRRETPVFRPPGEADHRLTGSYPHDRNRLAGYADILADAGISLAEVPIVESRPDTPALAAAGAAMLLDRAPEATAVLAASDALALALLKEARRRGISVPGELSVVGFDDVPDAAIADPPLTTVVQPSAEKGRRAAEMLFAGGPPRHEVLPLTFIVRGSTAPPRR